MSRPPLRVPSPAKGVSEAIGGRLDGLGKAGGILKGAATGFAGGVTQSVVRGGKIDHVSLLVDAFGNAIGNSIAQTAGKAVYNATHKESADGLEEVVVTATRRTSAPLTTNPDDSIRAGSVASGDQLRQQSSAPTTITVGKEGARGYWGVAKSMLGAGASDSDVQALALQLMTTNPGVTTLHQGDVLNLPNGAVSAAAAQTYSGMDRGYQAQRALNQATELASLGQCYNESAVQNPYALPGLVLASDSTARLSGGGGEFRGHGASGTWAGHGASGTWDEMTWYEKSFQVDGRRQPGYSLGLGLVQMVGGWG